MSSAPPSRAPRPPSSRNTPGLIGGDFTPVAPNRLDDVVIPDGFDQDLVIRWGDPVTADAPAFDVRHQTPESAARQWGYNNDYLCVLETSPVEGLLVCNHEFTSPELMFPVGSHDPATMKRVQIESHGMSVVEVRRHDAATGRWSHGARPTGATQPPDHRLDADPGGGPGRWRLSPPDYRRPGWRHWSWGRSTTAPAGRLPGARC